MRKNDSQIGIDGKHINTMFMQKVKKYYDLMFYMYILSLAPIYVPMGQEDRLVGHPPDCNYPCSDVPV